MDQQVQRFLADGPCLTGAQPSAGDNGLGHAGQRRHPWANAVLAALVTLGLALPQALPVQQAAADMAPGVPVTGLGNSSQVQSAGSGAAEQTHVVLTSKTVVLTPSEVSSSLLSVSPDGSKYTFSNDKGPLSKLAPGKVLLLEGMDALIVKGVSSARGKLVIAAAPASLGDVVQSGQIDVSGPPLTSGATGVQLEDMALGRLSLVPATAAAASDGAELANAFSFRGSSGPLDYTMGFKPQSHGLETTAEFCYKFTGSSCGSGLSLKVTLSGTYTWADQALALSVAGGTAKNGSFSMSGWTTQLDLHYTVVRGLGRLKGGAPPVIKIPVSFEVPLCGTPLGCAGLPLYSKFEMALLLKLGVSSQNTVVQGGVTVTITGSGSVGQRGLGVSGSGTFHVRGSFLPGPTISLGATGVEVAVQSKFGVGLGMRNMNVMYYLSAIAAIGETTGAAVAMQTCDNYTASFSVTGNAEAQFLGLSVSSPSKTLYDKDVQYKHC